MMLKAQFSVHWAESNLADRVEKDSFITLPGKGGNSETKWGPVRFLGMEANFFIPHFLVGNTPASTTFPEFKGQIQRVANQDRSS